MPAFVASMSLAKTTRQPCRSSARRTSPTPAKNSATAIGAAAAAGRLFTAALCRRPATPESRRPRRREHAGAAGNVARLLLRVFELVEDRGGLRARLGVLPRLHDGLEDRDLLLRRVLAGGVDAGLRQRLRSV